MGFAASSLVSVMSSSASAALHRRSGRHWMAPLTAWLARRATFSANSAISALSSISAISSTAARVEPQLAAEIVLPSTPNRPTLRVLKVVDGTPRQCAGRMVISGRMADVCAELDRLVARESQRSMESRAGSN